MGFFSRKNIVYFFLIGGVFAIMVYEGVSDIGYCGIGILCMAININSLAD